MGDQVEHVARELCKASGHDPDAMVTLWNVRKYSTPMGLATETPPSQQYGELWRTYRYVAEQALKIARLEVSE
jgi:hypothetical protein